MSAGPVPVPHLKAAPGACDTHLHIYDPRYPFMPGALIAPPPALIPDYRKVQQRLGLERVVIVQPSAYGTDNRCTVEAAAAFGKNGRCVVVVDQTVTDAELERLTRAGARGIRYFMLPGGILSWESLAPMAARVHEHGWHVQLQLDGRLLPDHEQALLRLPGDLVIDHVGKYLEPVPTSHPAFLSLLRLVETGRCWVKLSAPYETSKAGPPLYGDVGELAKTLVRVAPDRMVWASNWPHPSVKTKPDDAHLLDLLLDWSPDETVRRHILTDNPAKLYGF